MSSNTEEKMKVQYITVVSGLPRSGTSLMSMMLEAGGMTVLTDNIRTADHDNPKGYYEFERVKKMPEGDFEWLEDTKGKAVKVIAALLQHLPAKYQYKVIYMHRNIDEIIKSQNKMLVNLGKPLHNDDMLIKKLLMKHSESSRNWLDKQNNIKVLDIDYNQLIINPTPCLSEINKLLDFSLSIEKMEQSIDQKLYRNRV